MIVVTGANGFFGAHLVVAALKAKRAVKALYRPTADMSFIYYLLKFHGFEAKDITWEKAELHEPESLLTAFQGADIVIHAAGKVSFAQRDYDELLHVNRDGTRNVVNMALEAGVKKVIYISSIAALESTTYNLEKGGWNAFKKASPYGFSKYLGGLEVLRGKEEGLQVSIVNPGVIIGPSPKTNPLHKAWKRLNKGLKQYPGGSTGFTPAMDGAQVVIDSIIPSSETQVSLVAATSPFQEIINAYCSVFKKIAPQSPIPNWKMKMVLFVVGTLEKVGVKGVSKSGLQSLFTPADYTPNEDLKASSVKAWFEEMKAFEEAEKTVGAK